MARDAYSVVSLVGPLCAILTVAACSSVPDAANPVEWYKGTVGWVTGKDKDEADEDTPRDSEARRASSGGDEAFPSLSSVPDRAPRASSAKQREKMVDGLISDREHARYGEDVVPEPPAPRRKASTEQARSPAPVAPSVPTNEVPQPRTAPPAESPPAAAPPGPQSRLHPVSATGRPQPLVEPHGARGGFRQAAPDPYFQGDLDDLDTVVVSGAGTKRNKTAKQARASGGRQIASATFGDSGTFSNGSVMVDTSAIDGGWGYDGPAPAAPAAANESYQVGTVSFRSGSSRLSSEGQMTVRDAAAAWREHGGQVRVVGFASSGGGANSERRMADLQVSQQRAETVANELIDSGISANDIVIDAVTDGRRGAGGSAGPRAEIFLDF